MKCTAAKKGLKRWYPLTVIIYVTNKPLINVREDYYSKEANSLKKKKKKELTGIGKIVTLVHLRQGTCRQAQIIHRKYF